MSSRATQSQLLERRIAENSAGQQVDLATWIFEHVQVRKGDRILELCCGTGAQTLPMLDLVGEEGSVVALGVSPDALKSLATKAAKTNRLTLVECALEDFSALLSTRGFQRQSFDLVFCAYGLYYSADPQRTLREALSWLNPSGRVVIVGPFGPNNGQLFNLLADAGVTIPEPVIMSSERFMTQTVLPWGAQNFRTVTAHTMVNPVAWTSADRVLNYWQSTTFFDAERRPAVAARLAQHFQQEAQFVNEKWVMLVEMAHART